MPTSLFGLDASGGMLCQGRAKQIPACFSQGYAEQLFFADGVFEVFCVNALHHFAAPQTFIADAARVLGRGGLLAVVGGDPHQGRKQWYVYHYFAATYEADRRHYPTWERVARWMEAAGFKQLEFAEVEHIVDHKQGTAVFTDPYLRKESCSQLALLTDKAYEQGLRRMKEALVARPKKKGKQPSSKQTCLSLCCQAAYEKPDNNIRKSSNLVVAIVNSPDSRTQ